MANGSFQKFVNSTLGLYCEYSWAQSVSGNYSDVTVSVWVKYYSLDISSRSGGTVTVNGTSKTFSTSAISNYPSGGGGVTKLTQQTIRVSHNSDGTKTGVGISVSWPAQVTYSGTYYGTLSASTTINLPTIPRASSITSAGNVTLGNACSVKWTPASSSFKYKLKFSLSTWSYTTGFISPNTTSAYTYTGYTIPANSTLYNLIPDSSTATMTVVLTTYNSSGTQIGSTSSKTFTVTVPSTVKPTFGTITLTPATINSKAILVQGKNKLTVAVSGCSAGSGSSIKSYTFSGPSISSTTTSTSVTGGPISSTGTLTYTVTVTDNRNRTASSSKTITCYEYSAPSFTSFSAYRANSDGTANNKGTYMKVTYAVKYSSVNGTNAITVKIYGTGSTVTASGGSALINLNGDTTSSYQIYAIATDSYGGQASSSSDNVFGETRVLNITADGTGVAIGKVAESNELFECRWDAKFDGAASGPSGFATSSDRRVKNNIQDLTANIIDNLRPVQYELIKPIDGKIHYGFVAQDVNEVLVNEGIDPETVGLVGSITDDDQQLYVLSYTEFIPLLTKKCQALQAETNELRAEIIELKDMIKQISSD